MNIQPLAEVSAVLKWVFIGLSIFGVGITLYAGYRMWRTNRALAGEASSHLDPDADVQFA